MAVNNEIGTIQPVGGNWGRDLPKKMGLFFHNRRSANGSGKEAVLTTCTSSTPTLVSVVRP